MLLPLVKKVLGVSCVLFTLSCSSPSGDSSGPYNELKIQESIDQVNLAISKGDCVSAITVIDPIFLSASTRNDVRLAAASAHACNTGFKLFTFINDLTQFTGDLAGAGFWEFIVREFPSSTAPGDQVFESAKTSVDALLSVVNPGLLIQGSNWINQSTVNPGSLVLTQRQEGANIMLPFMTMAMMGSLLSRYGLPNSAHQQTQVLPWETPTQTQGNGCTLASSMLLFLDSLTYIQSISSTSAAQAYGKIQGYLSGALDTACAMGCQIICGGSVSCTSCPFLLRDRNQCTGSSTDVYSCAAAGLSMFVNQGWSGP